MSKPKTRVKSENELAQETEFYRRYGLPGCAVRYLDGGAMIELKVSGIEVGTKTTILKRGRVVSILYVLPSLDRLKALQALPLARKGEES